MNNTDKEYFRLLHTIINERRTKHNRTGVDTIGVFGNQAKFDLSEGFPILTTKKVWFKGILHELLWFIKGDTNIKYLVDNGVHIWDEWAYKRYFDANKINGTFEDDKWFRYFDKLGNRVYDKGLAASMSMYPQEEFIEMIKTNDEFAKRWGELGEGTYGSMWRSFPYFNNFETLVEPMGGECLSTVDQLQKVLDKLKTNPDDRRMIVSAWHPYWVDHCALPPCHCLFHFNTEELTLDERRQYLYNTVDKNIWESNCGNPWPYTHEEMNEKRYNIPTRKINLLLYQRSCDTFLGVPFNITSYSLLLAMVARVTNMIPGVFTHTYGDLHIYKNHLPQIDEQFCREPRVLPTLWLNPEVKSLFDFKYEDIKLEGYDPHPAIKGEVAV